VRGTSKRRNVKTSISPSNDARLLSDDSTNGGFDLSLDHVAIRASAGSGKTFQLTNRYLQLIAAGAEPSSILASTFTRLAAGQIRDRILTRLAAAAEDPASCRELAGHLELPLLSPAHATSILARLAKQMHVMQIRTLDSFFAAIVRDFAIELQVPLGAEVIDEEQAASLRARAVELMLDEHDPQRLIDLLRLLTQGASDRAITSKIDSTVSELYDLWREATADAWECVPQPPGRLSPPHLINAIKRLEAAACPSGDRWRGAFEKDCECARLWRWSDFLTGGMAKAVASGANTYYRSPIPDELLQAYAPVVRHAIAEVIGRVRDQTIATRDLLGAFHGHYEAVKRRQRAVTFADLAGAMIRAQKTGAFDEISFRLDAKLAHLLLDEFQDTSIVQWNALAPLAHEVTSVAPPQKSFFCVGDVKQSIYRWRDAAPEVLDELPRMLPGLEIRTLAKSYRSAPAIIDAVNQVFECIDQNAAVADHANAAAAWARGFTPHETAKTELPGYVELRFCKRTAENEEADVIRLRAAAECAAQLHLANPHMSIAVLTRTNRAVGRLLYELGPSRLNVPGGVSGRGGGPLTDAAPVNVILDMLQLADHPDDTVAAFNVARSPAGALNFARRRDADDPKARPDSWWNDGRVRRSVARTIRRSLLDRGYAATISEWVREIARGAACDARELRRLGELVTLADAFDREAAGATIRPADFAARVEKTRIADIQPAAVQVMTIHQAKGLEFEAVILAELGSKLSGEGTPSVIVERGDGEHEIGPVTRICRYMKDDFVPYVPDLAPMFRQHQQRVVRESLSVLYVAMTRAIHGLYMIVNPPETNKDGSASMKGFKTLAGVVRCALAPNQTSPDTVAFSHGNPDWHQSLVVRAAQRPDETPIQSIQLAAGNDDDGRFGSAVAASEEAEVSMPLARQLRLPDGEARDRGSALHALFEQIEWLEEYSPDEVALARFVRSRLPRREERWALARVREFLRAIASPAVRDTLSRRGADASQLQVHREHPFARFAHGGIQRGTIDRLVVALDRHCAAASATIIDFKTDACSAHDVVSIATHYRAQMAIYRSAVSEMLGVAPDAVAARLLFVGAGAAVDV
jgi:ATP-dependent helicase/nuclease subunit A